MRKRTWLIWIAASLALSALLGYVAYLSPGHRGHDAGAGLACAFVVFAITFIGPTGFTDEN
jgi:hypothetical protein